MSSDDIPQVLKDVLVASPHRAECGAFIHSMDDDGTGEMTTISTTDPDPTTVKQLEEIKAWAEADHRGLYFLTSGQVPLNPEQWSGQTPTSQDIRLHTCLSLDLDNEKRHPEYKDNPGRVQTALNRVLSDLGFAGYWLIESSPGNFNVMIPMRPSDNSSGRDVVSQKKKIIRLLAGRGDQDGLLSPLGADPNAAGVRREIRLPDVKRRDHEIRSEWNEAAGEEAPYAEGRRSSWWCVEEWMQNHAAKKYAARIDLLPRGWSPNCPHNGTSKDRVAWSILKYLLLLPDDVYCGTASHLAEWVQDDLEEPIRSQHIRRGLTALANDQVIEYETTQGRSGGTTIRTEANHQPPRDLTKDEVSDDQDQTDSLKPSTLLGSGASSSYCDGQGLAGMDIQTVVTSFQKAYFGGRSSCDKEYDPKQDESVVVDGDQSSNQLSNGVDGEDGSFGESGMVLNWEPSVGSRHQAMVRTAVFLVNSGGTKQQFMEWVKRCVDQPSDSRVIKTQEIEQVWTWANHNGSNRSAA